MEFKKTNMAIKTTIEIDCDPFKGMGRQADYFKHICERILHCAYYSPISTFFGCWTWEVEYSDEEQQKQVKVYLVDLYERDKIRYASW